MSDSVPAALEPVDDDGVRAVTVGLVLWAVATVACLVATTGLRESVRSAYNCPNGSGPADEAHRGRNLSARIEAHGNRIRPGAFSLLRGGRRPGPTDPRHVGGVLSPASGRLAQSAREGVDHGDVENVAVP